MKKTESAYPTCQSSASEASVSEASVPEASVPEVSVLEASPLEASVSQEPVSEVSGTKALGNSPDGLVASSKDAIAFGASRNLSLPSSPAEALAEAVARYPEGQLIHVRADGQETVQTYTQIWQRAVRLLAGMRSLGLQPGTPIIFQLSDGHDFAAVFWSCLMGGFVPLPLTALCDRANAHQLTKTLRGIYQLMPQAVVVTDSALLSPIQSILNSFIPAIPAPPATQPSLSVSSAYSQTAYPNIVSIESLENDESASNPDTVSESTFHRPQSDELALLLLSSGTTGQPKLMTFDVKTLIYRLLAIPPNQSAPKEVVALGWLPLSSISGLKLSTPRASKAIHIATEAMLQNPPIWLDTIEKHRVTHTGITNFFLALISHHLTKTSRRWDLSSLKGMTIGAEAIVAKTARQALSQLRAFQLGPAVLRPIYGMSECGVIASVGKSHFSLEGTTDEDLFVEIGAPTKDHAVRIVDAYNRLLKEGDTGRIQAKGPTMTAGYYQRSAQSSNPSSEQNKALFTDDGWLNTGDLGFLKDGRLTVTGREKEIIIINALNIHSHSVEQAVESVEGVVAGYTAACGVRRPSSNTDELLICFHPIAFDTGFLSSLLKQIRQQIVQTLGLNPSFIVPLSTAEIPRTQTGKLQRLKLKQRFESGEFDAVVKQLNRQAQQALEDTYVPPSTPIEKQLSDIWCQVLDLDKVGIHTNFFELGGQSLLATQVISRIRTVFDKELPMRTLFESPTIAELNNILEKMTSQAKTMQTATISKRKRRQINKTALQ
ncbi:MAG: non-ribosomal peptide synthetase [Cyanobacteria bacterium J06606_4]